MNLRNLLSSVLLIGFVLSGCIKSKEELSATGINNQSINSNPEDSARDISKNILIDASRDGGVWWFPQSSDNPFHSDQDHQGKALADWLASQGYHVDELPRGAILNLVLLRNYNKIIRAGGYGNYTNDEIQAYEDFLNRKGSLLLLQDHLANYSNDNLSEYLGVHFEGIISGGVTIFTSHPITAGVDYLTYYAGSAVTNSLNNSNMTILGSLEYGDFLDRNKDSVYNGDDIMSPPVMGILNNYPGCKIFFMGEMNSLESLPQPFSDNLFNWLFK